MHCSHVPFPYPAELSIKTKWVWSKLDFGSECNLKKGYLPSFKSGEVKCIQGKSGSSRIALFVEIWISLFVAINLSFLLHSKWDLDIGHITTSSLYILMSKVFPCFTAEKVSRLVIFSSCWSRLFDATLGPVSVPQKGGLSLAKVIHLLPLSSLSFSSFSRYSSFSSFSSRSSKKNKAQQR